MLPHEGYRASQGQDGSSPSGSRNVKHYHQCLADRIPSNNTGDRPRQEGPGCLHPLQTRELVDASQARSASRISLHMRAQALGLPTHSASSPDSPCTAAL